MLVDTRDHGMSFLPQQGNVVYRQSLPYGVIRDCDTNINATGLPNARSRILSEIKYSENLYAFSQSLNISNISLRGINGLGELKFMSIDFNSFYTPTFRLDLYISPGPAPAKGVLQTTYNLWAVWNNLAPDGSVESSSVPYSQLISEMQVPTLRWNWNYNNGLYQSMALTLDTGANTAMLPVYTYDESNNNGGFRKPFNPVSKTYGNLAENNLIPYTSFDLRGKSYCDRIPGTPVYGDYCF